MFNAKEPQADGTITADQAASGGFAAAERLKYERQRGAGARWHLRRRHWIGLDFVLAMGAILVAYAIRPPYFEFVWASTVPTQPGPFQAVLAYPWFLLLSMHVVGLHDPLGDRRRWWGLLRVGLAVFVALALCLLAHYFVSFQVIGRTILIRTFVLSVGLLGGARIVLWHLARATPRRIGCHVLPHAFSKMSGLVDGRQVPFEIVATPAGEKRSADELTAFFLAQGVEEVVVNSSDRDSDLWLRCLDAGIQVTDLHVFVEREYYKVPCDDIDLAWFLGFDLNWNHPAYHRVKRVVDLGFSAVGLAAAAPIIALAALAIMLDGGRPVFYSQVRVGFRGKPYRIWKLRTMRVDAELQGAQWAKLRDSRVTAIGCFLRRTRIDELPQFWNVLKGEMSIIGPRPERPEFVDMLSAEIPMYRQRHWMKPGITGWAQINYPYGASVEDAREKLCYDLYYLKNASILLDAHIILRTIGAVMKGSR